MKTSKGGKLLAAAKTTQLAGDALAKEKAAAFDLLDALTRSGALPCEVRAVRARACAASRARRAPYSTSRGRADWHTTPRDASA